MLKVSIVSAPPTGPSVKIHYSDQDKDKTKRTSVRFFGNAMRGINPPPPLQPSDPLGARYYVRDRDLGQTFIPRGKGFRFEAITLRTGPDPAAIGPGVAGAAVSLQIFTVSGHPNIHKPRNQPSKKLTDDFITGETYTSLRVVSGGKLPDDLTANQYLRWALTGDDAIVLEVDKKCAFLVMFDEPAAGQEFALANKYIGTYPDGHGIRREGSIEQPYDNLEKVFNVVFGDERDDRSASSLPLDPVTRLNQQPGTWGRPDVDTYRALRFYIEGS